MYSYTGADLVADLAAQGNNDRMDVFLKAGR